MANASDTDIANRALSKLGDERIASLSEDTAPGRAMAHRFPFVRDLLLQSYPWRFSIKLASLAADASAPLWGYTKRYLLPSDCLRLVSLGDQYIPFSAYGVQYQATYFGTSMGEAVHEVVGQHIHTDLSAPLDIQYVQQVTDTGAFPDVFTEAFACKLAMDAVEELTQSNTKREAAERDFRMAIKEARRVDAFLRPPSRRQPGSWIMSRYG